MINAWCYLDPSNKPRLLSCIYGPPYRKNKCVFWDSIAKIGEFYNGAWLCIGDFNIIVDQSEKFGGRPFVCSSADPFRLFINNNEMVDLGFFGNPFTWSNNRDGVHLFKERLDRVLASPQCIHLFPYFSIQHLPTITFNHNHLLLQTTTPLCWFIFIGYILVDKNTSISKPSISGIAITGTPYFQNLPEEYCRILILIWNGLTRHESAQNISKEGKFLLKEIF